MSELENDVFDIFHDELNSYQKTPITPMELHNKINHDSKIRGLKRSLDKYWEQHFTTLLNNGEMDFFDGVKKIRKMAEASKSKIPEWIIVTVNVDETLCTDIDKFKPLVEKYTKRAFIKNYIYSFEQRGEIDNARGKGIHAHILVRQTATDAAQFKRDTKNSFKKVTQHGVHFRYINTDVDQAIPYIKGIKKDDEKDEKITQDKLWRRENNLEDWYEKLQGEIL